MRESRTSFDQQQPDPGSGGDRPGAPPRGFPVAEFEERLARAQRRMAQAGLDALLFSTEPEVRYFTGFLTQFWQSPTRPWFLVVPAAGKPVAVIPAIGAKCMGRTWIEDVRTWSSPRPEDEGVSLLAEALRERCPGTARVGIPRGPETHLRMPLEDYDRLRRALPDLRFVDCTGLVQCLRRVKSAAEIAKIAWVCDRVAAAFEALPARLRPGMRERDVFREFRIECLERGVDDQPYLVGGSGPGGYEDIISPPSGRIVAEGDVLVLDTGATFDGYFCDFDRNYGFGRADAAARDAYQTLYEATEAGFAAVRPGARCADVFDAMQAVMRRGGALGNDVGRLGHGLGMQLTEWPSNTASDHTVLEPGMVLTLEPAMCFAPGRVMVHEENLVLEAGGPRYLTRRAPAELPIVGG